MNPYDPMALRLAQVLDQNWKIESKEQTDRKYAKLNLDNRCLGAWLYAVSTCQAQRSRLPGAKGYGRSSVEMMWVALSCP